MEPEQRVVDGEPHLLWIGPTAVERISASNVSHGRKLLEVVVQVPFREARRRGDSTRGLPAGSDGIKDGVVRSNLAEFFPKQERGLVEQRRCIATCYAIDRRMLVVRPGDRKGRPYGTAVGDTLAVSRPVNARGRVADAGDRKGRPYGTAVGDTLAVSRPVNARGRVADAGDRKGRPYGTAVGDTLAVSRPVKARGRIADAGDRKGRPYGTAVGDTLAVSRRGERQGSGCRCGRPQGSPLRDGRRGHPCGVPSR